MKLPPYWKIKREFGVVRQQLWALAGAAYEPLLQRHHDRHFSRRIRVADGMRPLKNKLALLLIHQPRGVPASVILTLDHLASSGYATLVVSNGPLQASDELRLAAHCWRCVTRPNYGYDFGGYRDGIRLIHSWNLQLDRLIVMNDSVWFPLYEDDRMIAELEAFDADLVGTKNFINRNHTGKTADGFLGSYFYLLNRSALEHPAYRAYWDRFRLSSNKYKVLRDGENRFTIDMVLAGLRSHALNSRREFLDRIAQQSPEFLQATLRYAAYIDRDYAAEGAALLASFDSGEEWQQRAVKHIQAVASHRHYDASFCYAHFKLMRSRYLKKNRVNLFIECRKAFVRAVEDGALEKPIAATYSEICNLN